MSHLLSDERIGPVLKKLYEEDRRQVQESRQNPPLDLLTFGPDGQVGFPESFFKDKLAALDVDKARFCYLLLRACGARRIVEVGTSHGVSTIFLAAAARDNGPGGRVVATEWDPQKTSRALANWHQAGVSDIIELRQGDVRDTLENCGPVDAVLFDIWPRTAAPALQLLIPELAPGAVLLCDNVDVAGREYEDYLRIVRNPSMGFLSMTLPFPGGLELSIRAPFAAMQDEAERSRRHADV